MHIAGRVHAIEPGKVQLSNIMSEKMVLLERIELSTSPLPRECSTSELQQRRFRAVRCCPSDRGALISPK